MRWARERAHKSQAQAAEFCGAETHASVGNWERGLNFPKLENLVPISELYSVSIEWLIWGGDMAESIDARVRKIPAIMRPGLLDRLHREIDETEKAVQRLPQGMAGECVKDGDPRLKDWAASNLKRRPPAKSKGSSK